MSVGENIKYLRKKAHLTQKQLSELTGIHEVTIRGYESGKYKPRSESLYKLRDALHCDVNDILDRPFELSDDSENEKEEITDKLNNGLPITDSELNYICNTCINKYYNKLNESGKANANKCINDLLHELELLTKVPDYQK